MTESSFLWHDYETFGADPRRDRPCQFAALRTDTRLEPIGDPVVWYCRPGEDMLPAPEACLITGITPQHARREGLPEYRFAEQIFELMRQPGTCSVGYNSFRFDDEVSRFLFWRNFIDPYAREFRNGNSRFDLIDVLRLTHALRPDGIEWPVREDGAPSFRLEDLAVANGLSIEHAHDALADVRNTLAMARLLRSRQPRLWDWALSLRARHAVEKLLAAGRMLLHASARFPADQACIAPVLPIGRHRRINSQWLVWNLRVDPAPFLDLDAGLLADLYWTPTEDLPEDLERLPVKWVRSNRVPMLAPTGVLDDGAATRTGIDLARARRHAETLETAPDFAAAVIAALDRTRDGRAPDAETALYEGFVDNADRALAERLRGQDPETLATHLASGGPFGDARLNELLVHFIGRHAPERLDADHREAWEAYRRKRLLDDPELAGLTLDEYLQRLQRLRREHPERGALLDQLAAWPREIGLDSQQP